MHTKHIRVVGLLIGLLLLMAGVGSVMAQDTGDMPHITIEATAEGFSIPQEMPEGIVKITFENNSEAPIEPFLARLNEGVTFDNLVEALSQGGEEAAVGLVSLLGGPVVGPETDVDVTYDLVPGTYLLVDNVPEEPSLQPFMVVDSEEEGSAPPEADVEMELVDFAFNTPIAVAAGPQVWRIANQGDQNHHMFIVPLDNGMAAGEFNEFLLRLFAGEEPEGPEPINGWFAMSPGEQAWITYDLEPGTYALVCVLPDMNGSGHIHAELGMRQILIVTE